MKTNEEKKIITISESNRFYKARMDIGRICREKNVDIGVGLDMYIHATAQADYAAEKKEFLQYVAHLQDITTTKDNRVARFFGEG